MKIAVIDDYQDAFRKLAGFARLKGHEVVVFHDTEKDPAKLAARLTDADAVLLTQQRSPFPRAVIEKLPKLETDRADRPQYQPHRCRRVHGEGHRRSPPPAAARRTRPPNSRGG